MPLEIELPETPETPASHKERTVGLIIAVIAVVLAIVTHIGNEIHQDEALAHIDAADQYNFYQAKKSRWGQLDLQIDTIKLLKGGMTAGPSTDAERQISQYTGEIERLKAEGGEIKSKGDELIAEAAHLAQKSKYLDIGEIALQISVVICSLTILTEQSLFVRMGVAIAGIGIAISAWVMIFMR